MKAANADALARLHADCFRVPRPWSAAELRSILSDDRTVFFGDGDAFIIGRIVADEAELLTLAVSKTNRRSGVGTGLVARYEAEAAKRGAQISFLEVAEGNTAARHLYSRCGYQLAGKRPGYFKGPGPKAQDALILSRVLTEM